MGGEDMGSAFWLIIPSFTAVVMDHRDKNKLCEYFLFTLLMKYTTQLNDK